LKNVWDLWKIFLKLVLWKKLINYANFTKSRFCHHNNVSVSDHMRVSESHTMSSSFQKPVHMAAGGFRELLFDSTCGFLSPLNKRNPAWEAPAAFSKIGKFVIFHWSIKKKFKSEGKILLREPLACRVWCTYLKSHPVKYIQHLVC
jgi:hypothetical protein